MPLGMPQVILLMIPVTRPAHATFADMGNIVPVIVVMAPSLVISMSVERWKKRKRMCRVGKTYITCQSHYTHSNKPNLTRKDSVAHVIFVLYISHIMWRSYETHQEADYLRLMGYKFLRGHPSFILPCQPSQILRRLYFILLSESSQTYPKSTQILSNIIVDLQHRLDLQPCL